jgi:hypothetical protein
MISYKPPTWPQPLKGAAARPRPTPRQCVGGRAPGRAPGPRPPGRLLTAPPVVNQRTQTPHDQRTHGGGRGRRRRGAGRHMPRAVPCGRRGRSEPPGGRARMARRAATTTQPCSGSTGGRRRAAPARLAARKPGGKGKAWVAPDPRTPCATNRRALESGLITPIPSRGSPRFPVRSMCSGLSGRGLILPAAPSRPARSPRASVKSQRGGSQPPGGASPRAGGGARDGGCHIAEPRHLAG